MSTAYMNLNLPIVGPLGTLGPTWASDLNTAIGLIDSHDHSAGKGKTITPAGININQDFSLNSYSLTSIAKLALDNLAAQPSSNSLIYEYGGELFFNDASGNQVQLTSGGAINVASLGTITGDYSTSTADLSYSAAGTAFIFKQSPTVTAEIDCGPVKIYQNVAGSPYAQIQQDPSQSGNLDWTLPAAYPASNLPLSASAAGVITTGQIQTAQIADSQVTAIKLATDSVETAKIKDLNVTTGKIADLAITTAKIANNAITQAKRAALGQQISASCGSFITTSGTYVDVTNLSVTITTSGRPVFIGLIQESSTSEGQLVAIVAGASNTFGLRPAFVRNGSVIASFQLVNQLIGYWSDATANFSPNLFHIDIVAAGTYTYKFQVKAWSGSTVRVNYLKLIAYEL